MPAGPVPLAALPEAALFGYGERLFRAGYAWEAHAVWEELWRAAARGAPEREALRAFIQLAAAALKKDLGEAAASRKLVARARRTLGGIGGGPGAAAVAARFSDLREAAGLPS